MNESLSVRSVYQKLPVGEGQTDGFLVDFVGAAEQLDQQSSEADINRIFNLYDSQRKGYITKADLLRVNEIVGNVITEHEAEQMLEQHAGKADFKAFAAVMLSSGS